MATIFKNSEKNNIGIRLVNFASLLFILVYFFNIGQTQAQCSASANTQDWTTLNWGSCSNPPTTDGEAYSGTYIISGLGNGEILSVDINVTLNGSLSLSSNAHATFRVKSGKTLIINGSVSVPNNNVTFYVEKDAYLIINGSLSAGGNGDIFAGSGTISATTLNIGKNAKCDSGGCPTIISTTCYSGGDNFCNNNVTSCSTLVGAAGTITGSAAVCAGSSGVAYSVGTIANASSYIWSLPSGASITSGENTKQITVSFTNNASSGNITVRGVSSCGSSGSPSSFEVTVNPVSTSPNVSISANTGSSICPGKSVTFTASLGSPSTGTYQWLLNGSSVGTNSNTYSNSNLSDGSTISCLFTKSGSCATASVSNTITMSVASTNTWVGAVSSNWNDVGNWCGGIPSNSQSVTIASNATYMPVIACSASCMNLIVNSGASVTLSSGTLDVEGTATINGSVLINNSNATVSFKNDLTLNGTWLENGASSVVFKGNLVFNNDFKGVSDVYDLEGIGKSIVVNSKLDVPVLDLKNYTLTINGEVTSTTQFKGNSSSNLIIGSGANISSPLKFVTGYQTLNNLTINKAGDLTLGSPLTIKGTLTFPSSGKIFTDASSILTFDQASSYIGASKNSFIDGPVTKITASTSSFLFPIGTDTLYRRIGVIPETSVVSAYTAQYFKENASVNGTQTQTVLFLSNVEYYDLHRISGASAKVIMYWGTNSYVNQNGDFSDLRIAHYNGSEWEEFAVNVDNSSTVNSGFMTTTSYVTNFSPFTPASKTPVNPLPVELARFSLTKEKAGVELSWETVNEVNNTGFEVQRSSDGFQTFEVLGFVNSQENNGNVYHFLDTKAIGRGIYYRLKQIDLNSDFHFSEIKYLEGTDFSTITKIYPNPTTGNVIITFGESEVQDELSYSIIGLDGVYEASKKSVEKENINQSLSHEVNSLKKGVYTILLKNGNILHSFKLIKI